MTSSFQEPTPESKRRWATAFLVVVLAAHLVLAVLLMFGSFDVLNLRFGLYGPSIRDAHYNLVGFWLVLGTWWWGWRVTGAMAAVTYFAVADYLVLQREGIMAAPLFSWQLEHTGGGLVGTAVPYLIAIRCWCAVRHVTPVQHRLQFSIFGIMYVTALLLLAFIWIDYVFHLAEEGRGIGAEIGICAFPGVITCWAALGQHRIWLPVALALLFGFFFDDWWFYQWTGLSPGTHSRQSFVMVLILLGTFLALRLCGYRLVPRRELRNAPARPNDAQ